jgi:hypothetical protein
VSAIEVSEGDVATYERDGVVCLRRVFPPRFPRVWPPRDDHHPSRSARFTDPDFRISI